MSPLTLLRSTALLLVLSPLGGSFAAAESLSPPSRVVAEGRVAPYPGAEITLAMDLAGTLEMVSVEEKQAVKKGSVVARLRVDELKA